MRVARIPTAVGKDKDEVKSKDLGNTSFVDATIDI